MGTELKTSFTADDIRAHDKALAAQPDWVAIAKRVATIVAETPPRLYYSASNRGFYHNAVHVVIPTDVVEVSKEEWERLLVAQNSGMEIVPDADGNPIAVDPESKPEEKAVRMRTLRDRLLAGTDGLVARHRDEVESEETPTLSPKVFSSLQSWRRALRQVTRDPQWPYVDIPPRPPGV